MSRVSVIIPTHNRAAMLPRAIESAKRAGTDLEIIVVDDASTDETQALFRDRKDLIYLRMEQNVGQARARNAGITRSSGEYIAFLDDDDLRLPNSLDMQATMLAKDRNLGFVYGPVYIGDSKTCLPTGEIRPKNYPTGDIFWSLVTGNTIYIASVLVRRRHIEAIGLFAPEVLGTEDWDAWLRLAAISTVDAVQQPVAIYRYSNRQSGQTSSNLPKMMRSSVRTQVRALRSPRALTVDQAARQEIRSTFKDVVWDRLVDEGNTALLQRDMCYAAMNYFTAIQLHPRRAARFAAIKNFTRSILSEAR
ncbi:MAG: glycosyltransferase family A protein [Stellaceae bacterium]